MVIKQCGHLYFCFYYLVNNDYFNVINLFYTQYNENFETVFVFIVQKVFDLFF